MLKHEVVDELRTAMYEDVGVMYDIYTQKWSEELLRDVGEYVPGITKEELDEYRVQDSDYVYALIKLASKVGNDGELLDKLLTLSREEGYELVKEITGDAIPFEDFKDIIEYGGKPFFKTFEGAELDDDELSEDELDMVAGGDDETKTTETIIQKTLEEVAKAVVKCYAAGSLVATPEGSRSIDEIRPGDRIYSLDKEGNRVETRVSDTTSGEAAVIEVHFENGKVWNTTSTQWFYDGKNFHNVWQHRDRDIPTLEGSTRITDIVETGEKQPVYDLVIEGNNVMFIDGIAAEGYGL